VDVVAQAEAADLLLSAYQKRGPIEPLVEKWDGLTIDDAYEIQLLQIRRRLSVGARIKGHKVGLASAVMQRQMGVNQPDFGHLLDDMFWLEHMRFTQEDA
jgi:2-keto-4-pentenoate hydratase